MKGHIETRYRFEEKTGRYKFTSGGNVLTGANATQGESGRPWRGFDPSAKGRHWAIPGFLAEQMPAGFADLGVLAKLDALCAAGLIEVRPGAAWPTPVRYLRDDDGHPFGDIWAYQPYTEGAVHGTKEGIDSDVAWMGPTDPERLGYQTQKPMGLLSRIIGSSCPPAGVVLDPFCGCGTSIAAAQAGARRWIGIDSNRVAIDLTRQRLADAFRLEAPRDYAIVPGSDDIGRARQGKRNGTRRMPRSRATLPNRARG
jgi:site-specific DNA-methyltransferase (adenine-specific)